MLYHIKKNNKQLKEYIKERQAKLELIKKTKQEQKQYQKQIKHNKILNSLNCIKKKYQ